MIIVGISGFACSGKDTLASLLIESSSNGIKIALADPIKRFTQHLWGFSDDDLWGSSENRNKNHPDIPTLSPRKALQQIGTNICRDLDENVYSRLALNIAKTLLTQGNITYTPQKGIIESPNTKPYDLVVISDARFFNELSFIQNNGGKIIRIKRESAGLKGQQAQHQSESEMLKMPDEMFDLVIENNGTLDDLKNAAKYAIELFSMEKLA